MALTTLDIVKSRLGISSSTHDAMLAVMINEVQSVIETRAGRAFDAADYTNQDFDGWGYRDLFLWQGPLNSVASVYELTYSSSGVTTTEVDSWRYVQRGTNERGHGHLRRVDGQLWTAGNLNYRVTFNAGFSVIPKALQLDSTRLVVAHFRRRDIEGVVSQSAGDLSATPIDPTELDRLADRVAASWRLRVGII